MELTQEQKDSIVRQEIEKRKSELTLSKAVIGTVQFVYYLTLGYFFDYKSHRDLLSVLRLIQ